MSLETKRIKELFGYARTLTKEQGVGVMAGRAVGFLSGGSSANVRGICRRSRRWRPSVPTQPPAPTAGRPSAS